jgi:branched-chain amino acid transport system permease protein
MSSQEVLQLTFAGLTIGSIYAIVALSFTIVFNATGVANFAQGEFVMLGGVVVASLASAGLPLAVAAIAAVAIVAAAAGAIHTVTIARVPRADVFSLIMITLGLSIAIRTLAQIIWGTQARRVPAFTDGAVLSIGGATITQQALWVIGGSAVMMGLLYAFFTRTRSGQAMLACSESQEGAALVGIHVRHTRLTAFILGGAIGALAGVLVAPITTALYSTGIALTLKGFAASVLGGFGNVVGAVVGGLLIGLLEAYGTGVFASGYQDLIAFAVLVAILIVRPGGILGSRVLT